MAAYQRITLEDLKDSLTERLGGNSTFWTADEKRFAINEALKIWQMLTGEMTTSFTIGAEGRTYENVPRQVVSTQRVLHDGVPVPLISTWELDGGFPTWASSSASTPQFWAPIGFNMTAFYPTPTAGNITFEGVAETPRLWGDGDYLMLGEEEVTVLVDYAHHYCTFKEGSGEMESSMPELKRMVEAAALRNSRLRTSAWYRQFMGLPRDEDQRKPRKQGGLARA